MAALALDLANQQGWGISRSAGLGPTRHNLAIWESNALGNTIKLLLVVEDTVVWNVVRQPGHLRSRITRGITC